MMTNNSCKPMILSIVFICSSCFKILIRNNIMYKYLDISSVLEVHFRFIQTPLTLLKQFPTKYLLLY